jgi:signal transduction histidine kinase
MPDYYHTPALILTVLLLPAFGFLYRRFRDIRTLLWLLGFVLALVRMIEHYPTIWWDFSSDAAHPWMAAAGEAAIQISAALFLASLSPLRFRIGRFKILYVIPFTVPLVIYAIVFDGVFRGIQPVGAQFVLLQILVAIALFVALAWSAQKGAIPTWLSLSLCAVMGGLAVPVVFVFGGGWPLTFAACANRMMTAVLVIYVFRRFSSGVFLSVAGFLAWSLNIFEAFPWVAQHPEFELNLIHVIVLGRVVAAVGMILLILEEELAINETARLRERHARQELEAYTKLILSRRRVEDFDLQGNEICQTVVDHSRFAQAALLLIDSSGRYRLSGTAGMDTATAMALGRLAARISIAGFLIKGSAPSAVEQSQTLVFNLEPLLAPGDDLKILGLTSLLAVPLTGRSGTEGALLLNDLRQPQGKAPLPLRPDDLLPLEMLGARLQASRSRTMMFEKLVDSEKYAGLGQLASNVTLQLNNPLTSILGFASLLEDASGLNPQDRKGVESILSEARRMKSSLESLTRISRPFGDQLAAVSVSELLSDMEELHRTAFLRRSIELRVSIPPSLPRVLCHTQSLRQAVLHCVQFAMEAVENQGPSSNPEEAKVVRLEATAEGDYVQILVAHTGRGFLHPDRAFDPFVPTQAGGETAGLGLSFCANILRDQNGRASAINLEPRGAAILLELKVA